MKMKDDEALEKLFEGMSRETARKVNNQGCPTKKATTKKKKKRNDRKIIAYFLSPRWVRTWRWVGNYLLSALSFLVNWLFL